MKNLWLFLLHPLNLFFKSWATHPLEVFCHACTTQHPSPHSSPSKLSLSTVCTQHIPHLTYPYLWPILTYLYILGPIYNYSEDYYGDLDLKSIRKSELLAGLNSEGRTKGAQKTKAASSSSS